MPERGSQAPAPAEPSPTPLARFRTVNQARLERLRSLLRPRQRPFLDLLPLLLEFNEPSLPGFAGAEAASGILDYRPSPAALALARELAGTARLEPRRSRAPDILGLYFMGSAGTVAHTSASDLDVWVCHRQGLTERALGALRAKVTGLAAWAQRLGLEVHFFVFDPERFRRGERCALSGESSGSSQHALLLDEFYRSGLVLAGAFPRWFQLGPQEPGGPRPQECAAQTAVDFGELSGIPAEEFFGAALWQLSKSIRAPYKSALKLLLMEAYAAEFPRPRLLSQEYKRAVCAGESRLERLDPYLLLYRKVEGYLLESRDQDRLELLRRCFYLKVGEPLGAPLAPLTPDWRRETLRRMTAEWGWEPSRLARLDAKSRWKVETVREEARALVGALTRSYRLLSDFARDKAANSLITQRDLNTLGRQLYAAYERKAGKLERVNGGIAEDLREEEVTLEPLERAGAGQGWLLLRGRASEAGGRAPLYRAARPVELLAWCHFNGVLDARSRLSVAPPAEGLDGPGARQVLEWLERDFPQGARGAGSLGQFERPASLRAAGLYVNVGPAPRQGPHLTSARNNPLSHGGRRDNLVRCLDLVVESTWEEVYTSHHGGERAVVDCLALYLRWSLTEADPTLPAARCATPVHGPALSRRLPELFEDAHRAFAASPHGRFLFELGAGYGLLRNGEAGVVGELLDGEAALLRQLGRPQDAFAPVTFDRAWSAASVLPAIYAANRAGLVQVFLHERPGAAGLYVLDEHGSLFHQGLPEGDPRACLTHLRRFLRATARRARAAAAAAGAPAEGRELEFHRLVGPPWRLCPMDEAGGEDAAPYLELQVIGQADEAGGPGLSVFCDQREYSSLEHGERVFEAVVADILGRRASGLRYPVYITDLDLSGTPAARRAPGGPQTCTLLHYKRSIEARLARALDSAPPA